MQSKLDEYVELTESVRVRSSLQVHLLIIYVDRELR